MSRKQAICWDCLDVPGDMLCEKHAAEKATTEYGRRGHSPVGLDHSAAPADMAMGQPKISPSARRRPWAGRGGTGKTTYGIKLIAQLSRGLLPGKYHGRPQAVADLVR
ncbi:MAG: hypothetical protein U5N53_10505 [Mycobacterium sp.]|nr:hypothetical protein [Mycobacterium sp.]